MSTVRPAPLAAMSVLLALGVMAVSRPAHACSCAVFVWPTPERCRTATRVFAGVVDSYDWPPAFRASPESSTAFLLAVDAVWRGAVPVRVVVETSARSGATFTRRRANAS